ncbi:winged helix DNA-binding domain-containing protein [Pseudarthrobacter sp. HLT3-5]|uniref:winged helix DNA-binding domain-containing protein n=1 Tax=Pseudarthrobacter cellobiosi TaxID=2953654 RepID=UPI00208FDED3|nr:winged helix DNA-binding domain-containing protein [Pseudarthrobacter sp. HLT3-5]MCO4276368.1 winged helix DNA-binding domain-containing protein [Pseudarthrobacter sp. HLT3-5]
MAVNRVSPKVMGRLRLASQGLVGPGLGSVEGAVRWMTATQAQDLQAALWAIGVRVPGAGLTDVRAALHNGSVVRSWPMRGTLHLVAPEDLRWMLDLTTERLSRIVAGRHRELDITWADVEKCRDVALERIAAGGPVSRTELFEVFEAAGQPTTGQRGIHILGTLCRHAWLVQGPLARNQQLLVAFDDWIPVSRELERQEAIAEFMLRYFRSHGPATIRDFAWWTQIPLTDVRAAFELVSGQLVELEFGGVHYWMSPETASMLDDGVPGQQSVLLLPGFDEFVLGYMDRSLVLAPEHANKIVPGGNGVFKKTVVARGEVIGTWARAGTSRSAAVVPELFDDAKPLGPAAQAVFSKAAVKYLAFLDI